MTTNPFRPGFGQYPLVAARRPAILRRWGSAFHPSNQGHPDRKTVLQGDRGLGKTVLLDDAYDIALENGWRVIDASGVHTDPLARRLIHRLWRPDQRRQATTAIGAVIGPVNAQRTWAPPQEAAPRSLREAIEFVLTGPEPPNGVLVEVDELHDVPTEQLKEVSGDLQLLERDGFQVGLVCAGLPTLDLDDPARTPTFLGRAFRPDIDAIDDDEMGRVFVESAARVGIHTTPGALHRVLAASGGLPYALQLIGYSIVDRLDGRNVVDPADVIAVLGDSHRSLIKNLRIAYKLSPGRRNFLAAMADTSGPVELATICRRLDRTPQQLSPVRAWLLANHYLTDPDRGELRYANAGLRAVVGTDPDIAERVAQLAPIPTMPRLDGGELHD